MNSICECTPGVFHPNSCHNEEGCVVDMHNRGKCPCTKTPDPERNVVVRYARQRYKSKNVRKDMFYGDQRI